MSELLLLHQHPQPHFTLWKGREAVSGWGHRGQRLWDQPSRAPGTHGAAAMRGSVGPSESQLGPQVSEPDRLDLASCPRPSASFTTPHVSSGPRTHTRLLAAACAAGSHVVAGVSVTPGGNQGLLRSPCRLQIKAMFSLLAEHQHPDVSHQPCLHQEAAVHRGGGWGVGGRWPCPLLSGPPRAGAGGPRLLLGSFL